jgi:hypothetical protein
MPDKNETTVVAVFDDYATAEQATRELQNEGVPQAAIQIESNLRTETAGYGRSEAGDDGGGIKGFFRRLFGADDFSGERGLYAEAVRRGKSIVAVTTSNDQVDRVVEVLNESGAADIDRHAEFFRQSGYERYDESAPAYGFDEAARERERFRQGSSASIPVIEEELQVGKRTVRRGGVRVYSQVVSQPVEEQVKLREEHVRVERRPANRPVEAGDMAAS